VPRSPSRGPARPSPTFWSPRIRSAYRRRHRRRAPSITLADDIMAAGPDIRRARRPGTATRSGSRAAAASTTSSVTLRPCPVLEPASAARGGRPGHLDKGPVQLRRPPRRPPNRAPSNIGATNRAARAAPLEEQDKAIAQAQTRPARPEEADSAGAVPARRLPRAAASSRTPGPSRRRQSRQAGARPCSRTPAPRPTAPKDRSTRHRRGRCRHPPAAPQGRRAPHAATGRPMATSSPGPPPSSRTRPSPCTGNAPPWPER